MKAKDTLKHSIYFLLILFVSVLTITSCSKDDEEFDGTVQVMVVNSIEGLSEQDLYLNNTKVTTNAVGYGENSEYVSAAAGSKRKAEFKASGSTAITSSANIDLKSGKNYTVILKGSNSANAETIVKEDDLSDPESGKAKVRFIHLSSIAPSVNVGVKNGATLFSNLVYGSVSDFTTVDAKAQTLRLSLSGSSSIGFDVPVTFQSGKIYTISASGATVITPHVIVNK
jgi:hypothetical protein